MEESVLRCEMGRGSRSQPATGVKIGGSGWDALRRSLNTDQM